MNYHRRYKVKDYQFGFQVLGFREKARLTQVEVATSVGVTERAIQNWEGGSSRPSAANLRKLIEVYVLHGAFAPGGEQEEARMFWEQGCAGTSHAHIAFDEAWFVDLLKKQSQRILLKNKPVQEPFSPAEHSNLPGQLPPRPRLVHWSETVDVSLFYGREQELAELEQWVLNDRCRLVALLGMGGMGKTVLSVKFAQQIAPSFDFVLWYSLHNIPPLEEIVADCLQVISEQQQTPLPSDNGKRISLLVELLHSKRCLLIFDNVETLLQEGQGQGYYRAGYEEYGAFIQHIAEVSHQSCLLLTSREMPGNLSILEGVHSPVRVLRVTGLGQQASQEMLKDQGLFGAQEDWSVLVQRYSGNPLALKIVAEAVRELFGSNIAAFLQEGHILFQDIFLLLNHQFERLSALEQSVMYWLAIERGAIALEELRANMLQPPPKGELLEALKALRRRCLVERGGGAVFTLQPVVLEYVTERLIARVVEEMSRGIFTLLVKYTLVKGQAKEYLRHSQMCLLLQPVLTQLQARVGSEQELAPYLAALIDQLREKPLLAQGYSGGNIVNLLVALKGNIRGGDFSHLMIRQAYLQGIEAQDANFADADLTGSVFMETFDSIASVALSHDGKYMAVGSFNGRICIWQVADGKPLWTLTGHSRMVWSIAFSPDSQMLASGSYDRSVKLWDVSSGRCLKTLQGHTEWVREVNFSADGRMLATGGDDETIKIWNIQNGACLQTFSGHTGAVWSVTFHPDGKVLASGSNDGTIRLWDVCNGQCLSTLCGDDGQIFSVAFSPDGQTIASGGDRGIRLWDATSQQGLKRLQGSTGWIWSVAFTPDNRLVSGSDDGMLKVWDVSSGQSLKTFQGHRARVWSIALAGAHLLASGSHDGIVKLWDTTSGQCLRTFQGYNRVICSVAFSPDGSVLVSGDDSGVIRLWDIQSGRCLKTVQGHNGRVWSVAFSPNGKTFVSGGNDRGIKVWDAATGCCLKILRGHTGEIWSVAFSPDGSVLASGSLDRTIKLWNVKEPGDSDCLRTFQGSNWIWSVAFHPNGKILASGSADGEITIWEKESGICLRTFRNGTSPIGSLTFGPDGKTLASSSNDDVLCIWEIETGQRLKRVEGRGHANWIRSAALSPNGTVLATGSYDTTVRVWNTNDEEQEPGTLIGHEGQVWSVAFSPDGTILASGSDDGTILLWDMQAGRHSKTLRSDRPFERANFSSAAGITPGQKVSLRVLGAVVDLEDPEKSEVESRIECSDL